MPSCCSALVTAINYAQIPSTFKGLWMSWCPGFISLPLIKVSKTCLPQVVFSSPDLELCRYHCSAAENRSPEASRAAPPAELAGWHVELFLCATHTPHPVPPKGCGGQQGIPNHPLQPPTACTSPNHADPALGMPARRMVPSLRCPTSLPRPAPPVQSLCNSSCITTWDWIQPSVFLDGKLCRNTFHYVRRLAWISSKQVCGGTTQRWLTHLTQPSLQLRGKFPNGSTHSFAQEMQWKYSTTFLL